MSVALLIDTFAVLGALFALWKGGAPERAAAVVVVLNVVAGRMSHQLFPGAYALTHLTNDGLTALLVLAITLRYAAPWMGGVLLFYAAQFALHSVYLVTDRPPNDYAHALINNINFSGVTWCLIIGTAVAWRRRTRRTGG